MNPGILLGAGVLLGSVGVKMLTSEKAKSLYTKGIVQGLVAKEEIETMVDKAKAEFDDMVAEAQYEVDGEIVDDEEAEDAEDAEENAEEKASK